MKLLKTITAILLSLAFFNSQAQNNIPQGFSKGNIVLADGSVLSGYLKDNIRRDAAVIFLNEANKKQKDYDGSDLLSAQIDNTKFICIRGDFFKVVSEGELSFLQKSSDASNKAVYNGAETAFTNGTDGKPGDYFIYNNSNKELKKVSKRNVDLVAVSIFAGCTAAIDKAKSVNGDMAKVKDAVDIYNSRKNN